MNFTRVFVVKRYVVDVVSNVWRVLLATLVVLMLSKDFADTVEQHGNDLSKSLNQSYWESLLSSHESILKAMRRHIRWMDGDTVAVTVVFQSTEPVTTRWFLGGDYEDERWRRLTRSEVHYTIPTEGDSNCSLRFTRSGRVTAAVLTVRRFRSRSLSSVHTIFTTANNTVQYQLQTDIKPRTTAYTSSSPDQIGGPEWLLIPRAMVWIDSGAVLDLQCAVFVPNDNGSRSNELTMSRIPLTSDEFVVEKVMIIHKDTQDQTEGINETLVVGRRYVTKVGHAIYHIGLFSRDVAPGSASAFTGAYHCRNERAHDRLDVVFSVLQPPVVPLAPVIYLISCDEGSYRQTPASGRVLTMTAGVPTCFRCRAAGRPTPRVGVYRNEDELVARVGLGVTKFVSVVDAWVAEATYTYHDPHPRADNGIYSCQASNSRRPPISIKFRIEVK